MGPSVPVTGGSLYRPLLIVHVYTYTYIYIDTQPYSTMIVGRGCGGLNLSGFC